MVKYLQELNQASQEMEMLQRQQKEAAQKEREQKEILDRCWAMRVIPCSEQLPTG